MIIVDPRDGGKIKQPGIELPSELLVRYLRGQGCLAVNSILPSADICFEGNGPEGRTMIGIERKTLHDLISCIHDGRLNEQLTNMSQSYGFSLVLVEGMWKPRDPNGILMESKGGEYFPLKHISNIMEYSEVYNYLMTLNLSGVTVTLSRDLWHSAYNIKCLFKYFQKKWTDHEGRLQMKRPTIASLDGPPTLTRLWASCIDRIGVKYSAEAERLFKTPIRLAKSDEMDWIKIGNIGGATAQYIMRQINGKV